MRYAEIIRTNAGKTYDGYGFECLIAPLQGAKMDSAQKVRAQVGEFRATRPRKTEGFFVAVECPNGGGWIGEDEQNFAAAMDDVVLKARRSGWEVLAIGRRPL